MDKLKLDEVGMNIKSEVMRNLSIERLIEEEII